jgi:hypothetical protein
MTMNGYLLLAEPVERAIRADIEEAERSVRPAPARPPAIGTGTDA